MWLKNGDVIMSGTAQEDAHVMVDMFSTLHLADVTHAQEGNYTCVMNNTPMLEVNVNVVSRTKLHTHGKRLYLQILGIYAVVQLCGIQI
jgi:hypothetical protein